MQGSRMTATTIAGMLPGTLLRAGSPASAQQLAVAWVAVRLAAEQTAPVLVGLLGASAGMNCRWRLEPLIALALVERL